MIYFTSDFVIHWKPFLNTGSILSPSSVQSNSSNIESIHLDVHDVDRIHHLIESDRRKLDGDFTPKQGQKEEWTWGVNRVWEWGNVTVREERDGDREREGKREREKVKEESLCYRSYHCPCFPYGSCRSTFLLFYTRLLPIYTIIYSTQCTLYKWGWSDWQTVPGDSGSTHCPLQMKMSLIQSNHEYFFFNDKFMGIGIVPGKVVRLC